MIKIYSDMFNDFRDFFMYARLNISDIFVIKYMKIGITLSCCNPRLLVMSICIYS